MEPASAQNDQGGKTADGQGVTNNVTINQGLDPAMFDQNSGYDPNKPASKQNGKH